MEDPKEKVAILMWDELALSKHMDHDTKRDRVTGVEEWGPEFRTEKIGIKLNQNNELTVYIARSARYDRSTESVHCKSKCFIEKIVKNSKYINIKKYQLRLGNL